MRRPVSGVAATAMWELRWARLRVEGSYGAGHGLQCGMAPVVLAAQLWLGFRCCMAPLMLGHMKKKGN